MKTDTIVSAQDDYNLLGDAETYSELMKDLSRRFRRPPQDIRCFIVTNGQTLKTRQVLHRVFVDSRDGPRYVGDMVLIG